MKKRRVPRGCEVIAVGHWEQYDLICECVIAAVNLIETRTMSHVVRMGLTETVFFMN
jgi:hypothetical protein